MLKKVYSKISDMLVLILIVVAIFVVMSIASPYFLKLTNMLNLIQYVSTFGIVAIGMTMVILTGGINLSVGGTMALSSFFGSMMMVNGYPWPLAVLLIFVIGAVIGFINGTVITKLSVPPLIATLAMEQIARGLHLGLAKGGPLSNFPEGFRAIGSGTPLGIPMAVWWTVGLFILFGIILTRTKFGRNIYAVGGNPMATRVAGVNNHKTITTVYVLCGLLCSMAGIIVIGRVNSIALKLGEGLDMQAITACVLGGASVTMGGKGKLVGTFFGVLIMGLLQNAMDLLQVDAYWQTFVQGLVLLLAISIDSIRTIRANAVKKVKRTA